MNNQKLGMVNEEKDAGVLITDDLKPSSQCRQAYAKASRVLGMISRTISYKTLTVLLKMHKRHGQASFGILYSRVVPLLLEGQSLA